MQPTSIAAGSLLSLTFGYGSSDNNGNVLSQSIAPLGVTQSYTYDPLNRLQSAAEGSNWSQTFDGRYGNRRVTARTGLGVSPLEPAVFDGNNRIADSGWQDDAAGNVTLDPANDVMTSDGENRLVRFAGGGMTVDFSYDGEGRRVKKVGGGDTTVYVYSAMGQLAAEYGSPAGSGGRRYLTRIISGSTRLVTDEAGQRVECRDYLPFGEEILASAGSPRLGYACYSNDSGVPQQFTGKERDAESGLDYFGGEVFQRRAGQIHQRR